jgi:predicted AlkP superfamily phosphohydrolase/phosphomutase
MRFALFAAALLLTLTAPLAQAPASHTHLVIVVDGLRPDNVTPEVMPRLYRLGRRGIVFGAHHSVFPTVTRVNASSFVTGTYPETHGLLGTTISFRRLTPRGAWIPASGRTSSASLAPKGGC